MTSIFRRMPFQGMALGAVAMLVALGVTTSAGHTTWEGLLAQVNLTIKPWFRTFKGTFTPPGSSTPQLGYWMLARNCHASKSLGG